MLKTDLYSAIKSEDSEALDQIVCLPNQIATNSESNSIKANILYPNRVGIESPMRFKNRD